MDPDVAAAISYELAAGQTVINGQTIPLEYAPTNPPGYDGSTFTLTEFGLTETVKVKRTSTITVTPTRTTTIVVPPTAKASCDYWYVDQLIHRTQETLVIANMAG